MINKSVILVIIDGWGISPSWGGNAIAMNTPTYINALWRQYPHTILQIFEDQAKLKRIGNSEVGHASLGAGRIIQDDFSDINELIRSGKFFSNRVLKSACKQVLDKKSVLHIVGMLSGGEVHGNIGHVVAMLKMAKKEGVKNVGLHLITDGKDDLPFAALKHLDFLERVIEKEKTGTILTIMGRRYAMDRGNNWELTDQAYLTQTHKKALHLESAKQAIETAYEKGYCDHDIPPFAVIYNDKRSISRLAMKEDDIIVMTNFRSDGMRQLAAVYLNEKEMKQRFAKLKPVTPQVVTFTDYGISDKCQVAFPTDVLKDTLAEIIDKHGLRQLKIGESLKEENITYFFNGGRREAFDKEDRIIVRSPKSDNLTKRPALSLHELTKRLCQTIRSGRYSFIAANIANPDIIAHTGDIAATGKAIAYVDEALKQIVQTAVNNDSSVIITADHGNAEQMIYQNIKHPESQHTSNPVPFILITPNNQKDLFKSAVRMPLVILNEILSSKHTLADVAPTILDLLGLPIPATMIGKSLLKDLEG